MEKGKKCPNCGYVATKNQDICPNCDQFETRVFQPLTDDKIAELNAEKEVVSEPTEPTEIPDAEVEVEEVVEETALEVEAAEPVEETPAVVEVPKEEVSEEGLAEEAADTPEATVEEAMAIIREVNEANGVEEASDVVEGEEETPSAPTESETNTREEVVIEKFERPQVEEAREIVAAAAKEKAEATSTMPTEKIDSTGKKELSKKGKRNRLIALILILLLVVGGGYFAYTNYTAKKEAEEIAVLKKEVATLHLEGEKLYFNEERIFLSKDFDQANLEQLKTDIKALDKKADKGDLTDLVVDLEVRASKQEELNQLFTTPLVVGNELNKKAVLKASDAAVPAEIKPEEDELDKLLNEGRKEVEAQVKQNEKTEKLMKAIYTDKVNEKASQKMYDEAKASVEKLKDPALKEKYEKQLKEVQAELKKAEAKKEKEKAAAEKEVASAPAPAQNQPQTQPQTQSGTNNNNNYTANAAGGTPFGAGQGLTTQANKNSITYVDVPEEGAWAWAPGVKETVLAECISRGYMVEGGYVLRQKEVINGEGYYDLYATSTASKLLKNRSDEELPIYLVTINAKTGWYQGEGPN